MVKSYGTQVEKVTFNIPAELKEKVLALKDELHVSLSAIYNDAISDYIRQKELEKWQLGIDQALSDADYTALGEELGSESGDVHAY
jgi:predicted transcriptional regulator